MIKKLFFIFIIIFSSNSYSNDKNNKFILDMAYNPLSATCLDLIKQVSAFHNRNNDGVYLQQDILRFEKSLHIIWGVSDASYITKGLKTNPPLFFGKTFEECNKNKNIEEYWSDFISIPALSEEDEYGFSPYFFSSCTDVYSLLDHIFNALNANIKGALISDSIQEHEINDYNKSVIFKNYINGFSQIINVDFGSLAVFLGAYCNTRPDDTTIENALEYAAENPILIKK